MRIAKVVGLATAEDQPFQYVVLEEMSGARSVDARPSDALNLATLVQARSLPPCGAARGRGQTRRGFP
jgi:bifunctional DNase/RNase